VIHIDALGPLDVVVDDTPPPRELLWRKNLGLLLYLARSRDQRRPRDRLTGMLWGDKPDADARHSLNEALRVIRKSLPDGTLMVEGDLLRLEDDAVSLDVERFADLVRDGAHEKAIALVRGTFAEGFSIPDSNEFEDWLSAERRHWGRLATEALVAVAGERLDDGDLPGAREAGRRAAAIDPVAEAPAELLVRCDAIAGDPSAALATYQAFTERLQRELQLEPPASLQRLADRIRARRAVADASIRAEDPGLSRRLPLVGRGEALRDAMRTIRAGREDSEPQVVFALGGAGTGKTRLAEEIVARATLEGFRSVSVRCDVVDRGTVHGALRALTENTELFCDEPAWSDPSQFAGALERETRAGPVLVWIDDSHLLDPDSIRALPPLIRDLGDLPVVFLLSAGIEPPVPGLDDVVHRVGRDLPGTVIRLEALAEDDLERLARRALPDWSREDVARLTRRLAADTAGLPLLAVDLLHALRLGLEVSDEASRPWPEASRTLEDPFPTGLPEPLVAAVRVGFRRLSPGAQEVLKVAAVADARVTPALLERATDLDDARILEALDELEWRRWLVAEARGYTFTARLHQEIIGADLMTKGQRRRLEERLTAT
jgi:DNA-binding SARP family transcriptional activator